MNASGPPSILCSSFPMHRLRVDLPRCTLSVALTGAAAPCGATHSLGAPLLCGAAPALRCDGEPACFVGVAAGHAVHEMPPPLQTRRARAAPTAGCASWPSASARPCCPPASPQPSPAAWCATQTSSACWRWWGRCGGWRRQGRPAASSSSTSAAADGAVQQAAGAAQREEVRLLGEAAAGAGERLAAEQEEGQAAAEAAARGAAEAADDCPCFSSALHMCSFTHFTTHLPGRRAQSMKRTQQRGVGSEERK
jgi:hypothetical protein